MSLSSADWAIVRALELELTHVRNLKDEDQDKPAVLHYMENRVKEIYDNGRDDTDK